MHASTGATGCVVCAWFCKHWRRTCLCQSPWAKIWCELACSVYSCHSMSRHTCMFWLLVHYDSTEWRACRFTYKCSYDFDESEMSAKVRSHAHITPTYRHEKAVIRTQHQCELGWLSCNTIKRRVSKAVCVAILCGHVCTRCVHLRIDQWHCLSGLLCTHDDCRQGQCITHVDHKQSCVCWVGSCTHNQHTSVDCV